MTRALFVTFLILITGCVSPESPIQKQARLELTQEASSPEYPGSIYTQARLDGIEYRPILIGAIHHDEQALSQLFGMNFMGEGGETHCENLLQLMNLWGDERFSKVLHSKNAEIRDLVIDQIGYSWGIPDWSSYPKTYGLISKP